MINEYSKYSKALQILRSLHSTLHLSAAVLVAPHAVVFRKHNRQPYHVLLQNTTKTSNLLCKVSMDSFDNWRTQLINKRRDVIY